ncbi:MAG: metallophosphoesterase [Acidilobaceae archaeon]
MRLKILSEASILYAVSDIHSPRFLQLFRQSLRNLDVEPCIFILAGDIIDKGRVEMMKPVVEELASKWSTPIIAVFGNEEYHSVRDRLRREYSNIIWLDDSLSILKCSNIKVAVIGTQGAIDRLTKWQSANMPWLEEEYKRRPEVVANLISEARRDADIVILVSHYALTSENLKGEDPKIWPEMFSKKMEKVLVESRPNIAIHGHSHLGRQYVMVKGVPVYNVALPLTRNITKIKLPISLKSFIN